MKGIYRMPEAIRDYPRLKAIVALHQSAATLDTVELLRLAEDPAAPPCDQGSYEWANRFAIPIIRELRQRLERAGEKSESDPKLIRLLREMRKSQKGRNRELRAALEAEVDELISAETQPLLELIA